MFAVVAELAYALDSGSSPGFQVRVQVPSTARLIKQGFGSFQQTPKPLFFDWNAIKITFFEIFRKSESTVQKCAADSFHTSF